MSELAKRYDVKLIRRAIDRWNSTTAVGGNLDRTANGIGGTIQMRNRSGQITFTKEYAPEDFFKLLGDIDVDVMHQVGFDPPNALNEYLHQSRCAKPESIDAFGKTAFEPREQMLTDIATLLQNDPGFGDAHGWWANQYAWTDKFSNESCQQKVLALNDRLTASLLWDVDARPSLDPDILKMYSDCIERAAKIAGEDAADVAAARLNFTRWANQGPTDLRNRALILAAKYPNHSDLAYELSSNLIEAGDIDAQLAGSIAEMDSQNLYDPGVGDRRGDRDLIARCLYQLGRSDLQLSELSRQDLPSTFHRSDRLRALITTGHWQRVLDDMDRSPLKVNADNLDSASLLVLAAALIGDDQRIVQTRDQWRTLFDEQHLTPLIDLYLAARQGTPFVYKQLDPISQLRSGDVFYCGEGLTTLADQMLHSKIARLNFLVESNREPNDRLGWVFFAEYARQFNYPRAGGFFEALKWLYPNDPWVATASAAFDVQEKTRSATNSATRPSTTPSTMASDQTPETILGFQNKQLDAQETVSARAARNSGTIDHAIRGWLNPFDIAGSVHHLLVMHDVAGARELAQRYHDLVQSHHSVDLRAWATMVLKRVQSDSAGTSN